MWNLKVNEVKVNRLLLKRKRQVEVQLAEEVVKQRKFEKRSKKFEKQQQKASEDHCET